MHQHISGQRALDSMSRRPYVTTRYHRRRSTRRARGRVPVKRWKSVNANNRRRILSVDEILLIDRGLLL